MSQEKYHLYFGDLKVGMVVKKASDFPNLWGAITYSEWLSDPQTPEEIRVAEFLELNRKSIYLIDVEQERDVSVDIAKINQQLNDYLDLVETDAWYLLDESSHKHLILCPIFRHGNEVVWRWNLKRDSV